MMQGVYSAAAGRRIHGAAVIAYASAGDFVRRCSGPPQGWNPHLHGIFLDVQRLAQYFRASMVAFFLRRSLVNERLAKSMLGWTHSGFNLDMSVKIPWPAAARRAAGGTRTASCTARSTIRTSTQTRDCFPRQSS
jgi:hypothetical protein